MLMKMAHLSLWIFVPSIIALSSEFAINLNREEDLFVSLLFQQPADPIWCFLTIFLLNVISIRNDMHIKTL